MKTPSSKSIPLTIALAVLLTSGCTTTGDVTQLDPALTHTNVLTLDTHVDIPLTYMKEIDPGADTKLQVDLGKLDAGELDAAFFIIYTPQTKVSAQGLFDAKKIAETRYAAINQLVTKYNSRIELALTAADVRRINASGKKVALIGMENAYPIGRTVNDVPKWADRGVRYMGITHFGHNQFGDSSNPNPKNDSGPLHNGLSPLGKQLVSELNDHGIMVDVSHAGKETMMQAADLSRTPIIASHSGVKAVADTARNLDDEQLLKLKEVGGVAQMVALGAYVKILTPEQEAFRDAVRKELGLETADARRAMTDEKAAEYERRMEAMYDIEPRASVADFVDHIDHAVKVAGIDHVGIASDFDGGGGIEGWKDASETQNVTAELIKRGYSEAEIAKIWGGNLLRVLEATEAGVK